MMYAPENQNSNERESAAQMGFETEAIRRGMRKEVPEQFKEPYLHDAYIVGRMSFLLWALTRGDRADKHCAEQEVNRLIELGKGA